jgi:hypothetical protein
VGAAALPVSGQVRNSPERDASDRYSGEGWLEAYGERNQGRVVVEDEEWYDPTDWFDGDDRDYEYVDEYGDEGWGWEYDRAEAGAGWGFLYYGDRDPSWDQDDYGDDRWDDGGIDSRWYDPSLENADARRSAGRSGLALDAYAAGYDAGFSDDSFGIDDWGSDWSLSYSDSYSTGYYDGFYDSERGYSHDAVYYISTDRARNNRSDRERADDSTRRRGDRMMDSSGDRMQGRSGQGMNRGQDRMDQRQGRMNQRQSRTDRRQDSANQGQDRDGMTPNRMYQDRPNRNRSGSGEPRGMRGSSAWSGRGQRASEDSRSKGQRSAPTQRGGQGGDDRVSRVGSWEGGVNGMTEAMGTVSDVRRARKVGELTLFRLGMFDGVWIVAAEPGMADRLRELESVTIQVLGEPVRVDGQRVLLIKRMRRLM